MVDQAKPNSFGIWASSSFDDGNQGIGNPRVRGKSPIKSRISFQRCGGSILLDSDSRYETVGWVPRDGRFNENTILALPVI